MDLIKLANSFGRRESSEHLKLLAKRAAGLYVSKEEKNLTSAVTSAIRGEGLNKDQMRRVSEMANQATWKETFSEDRKVNFEPANSNEVISSFSEEPKELSPSNLDYLSDPPKATPKDVNLEEAFGVTNDAIEYPSINPFAGEQEEVSKAASAMDTTRYALDQVSTALPKAAQEFLHQVKQAHLLEGHPLLKIAKAVGAVTNPNFATSIMKTAAEGLKREGVRFNIQEEKQSLNADVIINTDHDLIRAAVTLEKVASATARAKVSYNKTKARYDKSLKVFRNS